jgi:hypothetical protein
LAWPPDCPLARAKVAFCFKAVSKAEGVGTRERVNQNLLRASALNPARPSKLKRRVMATSPTSPRGCRRWPSRPRSRLSRSLGPRAQRMKIPAPEVENSEQVAKKPLIGLPDKNRLYAFRKLKPRCIQHSLKTCRNGARPAIETLLKPLHCRQPAHQVGT